MYNDGGSGGYDGSYFYEHDECELGRPEEMARVEVRAIISAE